jgi:hypothetical protein
VAVLGVHSLCTGPLLGHTPTACIALSFGLTDLPPPLSRTPLKIKSFVYFVCHNVVM